MSTTTVVVGVGYVGARLLNVLPDELSLGLSRSPDISNDRIQTLDLDDDNRIDLKLPQDCTIVYTVPPARGNKMDLRLQQFLQSLRLMPRRFIYLSTSGVYGNRDGAVVNETAALAPESTRAKLRVSAERDLSQFCEQNKVDLVILRVPGIYGPGRLGSERIKEGQPVLHDADANPGNRIHVDDLVASCSAAMDANVPIGNYNIGDGDERTSTWFAFETARQLKVQAPPMVSRAVAEKTFSTQRLSFLRESRRLDLTKMHEILKPKIKYSNAADGIAASIAEEIYLREM